MELCINCGQRRPLMGEDVSISVCFAEGMRTVKAVEGLCVNCCIESARPKSATRMLCDTSGKTGWNLKAP